LIADIRILAAALASGLVAAAAGAQELPLPRGATLTHEAREDAGRYALPTGPWQAETGLPARVIEGPVQERAWRLPAGLSAQQVIRPIRRALSDAGWEIVLDCEAAECGGFDFRFATRVVPAPAMFVDLRDYRAVAALAPDGRGIAAIASSDPQAGYLQIIRATPAEQASEGTGIQTERVAPPTGGLPPDAELVQRLEDTGHVTLRDLDFASGATALGESEVDSLDRLAAYLAERPDRRILFVGHTDATGTLEVNQALSRRRAQAAVDYMLSRHATDPGQIAAEGAGYLAPVASNLTEAGRHANRRVDAVLLPRD
jgi:OOP family OmpA-OmpF porin